MSGALGSRRALAALLLWVLAALCAPAPARADLFGPISLVSAGSVAGGPSQQAEYAHDAAISGDGRYVAFDGSVGGVTGVWRRDLATGAIEAVAGGDAELPSISETGRYISFTSTEDLVPEDEARGPNVWVRDMQPGPGEPEYILASALDGSSRALTYEYGANPVTEARELGSVAVGRSALGEGPEGPEVAFVTTAVSNLAGAHTPALQVAVRYLRTDTTVLVSRCFECANTSEPVSGEENGIAYGAVYPGAAAALGFGPPAANGKWAEDPPPGASISADGSTVAWMGEEIGKQARMLPGETPLAAYTEPLWRRIQPGSETPTERVTGGSDPANPACAASGEAALPTPEYQSAADPCQGPFEVLVTQGGGNGSIGIWPNGVGNFVPRLSADGYTVAFLSEALRVGYGLGFANSGREGPADLYVADMHPGLTRVQALTPLTELAGVGAAESDPITDFDISAEGTQVAFTTRRTEFPLGSPAYVSPVAAEAGESELFDVDLADDTLTRVTHGYEGEPSEQAHGSKLECKAEEDVYCSEETEGAQSPSLNRDGELLAFSSTASNLVRGDGNAPPAGPFDGSDAFVVQRDTFAALPTPQYTSPPPQTALAPLWRLDVTELSLPDGSVRLYVQAPGAGTLYAVAHSPVLVTSAARASKRRHAPRASKRMRTGRASRRAQARTTVATRTVASTSALVGDGGAGEPVELVLTLAKPYAALAARGGGVNASVNLSFDAPGHPPQHQSLAVTFVRTPHPARAARRGRGAAARARSHR